jgi:hypothetical protein
MYNIHTKEGRASQSTRTVVEIFRNKPPTRLPSSGRGVPLRPGRMAWVFRPLESSNEHTRRMKEEKEQTVDGGIVLWWCIPADIHIYPRSCTCHLRPTFHIAIRRLALVPPDNPRQLPLRRAVRLGRILFERSRALLVLIQRVEILDVRLPILLKVAKHGKLARRCVLRRGYSRGCQ